MSCANVNTLSCAYCGSLAKMSKVDTAPATGRLGVLLPGLGAVSTTFIAGVLALRKELAQPIGSLTQLGTLRLGKRTDHREVPIRDFVPLAKPDRLVFGGWDIFPDNVYAAARKAGVLERELLDQLRPELEAIAPMQAVFEKRFVRNLDGSHVKPERGHRACIEALCADIRKFRKVHKLERAVMVLSLIHI